METQTVGYYLSPQQSLVWLAQQNAGLPFLTQVAVLIEGKLDAAQLQQALGELVARHEMLRTVFRRRAGMKIPFQVILEHLTPGWETTSQASPNDVTVSAKILLAEQAQLPFDMEQGPHLLALLCTVADDRHLLILTIPAICADSSSLAALVTELFNIYANPLGPRPDEPIRYMQFAQWQGELLEPSEDDTAVVSKKFWLDRAESGEQQLELPSEVASEAPGHAEVVKVSVSAVLAGQIQSLATAAGASNRDVLLATWQSLLYRLTGRPRLALGVTLAGREYEELASAVGLIAKMVPIHTWFNGNPTFLEAVGQAKAAIDEAAGVQEYLDPATAFTGGTAIGFSFSPRCAQVEAAGLRVSCLRQKSQIAPSKLRLDCEEVDNGLELQFQFDAARYRQADVEQLAKYFLNLLTAGVDNPKQQVARLTLLDEADTTRQFYEWNTNQADYPRQTMHSLIEEQVWRTPERMALRCGDRALTYAEMNRQANQLAHQHILDFRSEV